MKGNAYKQHILTFFCLSLFSVTTINAFEQRIVNGFLAKSGQFPWQVSIQIVRGNRVYFCGGALISSKDVLTAGHCVQGASYFLISAGSRKLSKPLEQGSVTILSRQFDIHENYNPLSLNNDVAVIHTPNISFTSTIQPIALGTKDIDEGVTLRVSGWGKTSDAENNVSPLLYYADVLSITNEECLMIYNFISLSQLCCVGKHYESTCSGDSGGPLIQQNSNGSWVHVGVVSFIASAGCTLGFPYGFTRTASYLQWIKAHTN